MAIASVGEIPRPQLDATSPHPCTGSKNTLDHQKQDSCFSIHTSASWSSERHHQDPYASAAPGGLAGCPGLSRWPRDAQSANPQATIPYDGVGLHEALDILSVDLNPGTVIQHYVEWAIQGGNRILATDPRESIRKDTCILCGHSFSRRGSPTSA